MTTTTASGATTGPTSTRRPQWRTVTTYLLRRAAEPMLWALGVMVVVSVVLAVAAHQLDWRYEVVGDGTFFGIEVVGDDVTVSGPFGPVAMAMAQTFFVLAGTALVMAVVLPAVHVRALLVSGATRRSVTIGLLLVLAALTASVAALLALIAVSGGRDGMAGWLLTDEGLLLSRVAMILLVLAALLATASAVTLVFLRWSWWVGTIVAGLVLVGLAWASVVVVGGSGLWQVVAPSALLVGGLAATVLLLRRMPAR